jgi:hypothetical protein
MLKDEGVPVVLERSERTGRFVVACADFKKGDLIFREDPYVAAVDNGLAVCDHCYGIFSHRKQKLVCNKCEQVAYCSAICKQKEQENHAHECPLFEQLTEGDPPAVVFKDYNFSMAKLLIRAFLFGKREADNDFVPLPGKMKTFGSVLQLVTSPDIYADNSKLQDCRDLASFVQTVFEARLGWAPAHPDLVEVMGKEMCNSFGIYSCKPSEGVGFYVSSALMNHSCHPNVFRIEDGRTLEFRAYEDIPKGTELNINYSDISHSYTERQQHLDQYYHFQCGCRRCVHGSDISHLISLKCPLKDCEGSFQNLEGETFPKCSQCGLYRLRVGLFSRTPHLL